MSVSKSAPAPSAAAAVADGGGGDGEEGEDFDADMAFLEQEIKAQKQERRAAAKADPSHGWKRWVSKDGVLTAPPDKPADVARSAALKKSLQSKVAAKEEERQAKKKPAS